MPLWLLAKGIETTTTETTETGVTTTTEATTEPTTTDPTTVILSLVMVEPLLPMPEMLQAMKSILDAMELSAYPWPTFVLKEKTNVGFPNI